MINMYMNIQICNNLTCDKNVSTKAETTGKYCSLSCSTSHRNYLLRNTRTDNYNKNPQLCVCCKSPIPYQQRNNKACSQSCSAKYSNAKRAKNGWQHTDLTKTILSQWSKQNPRGAVLNPPPRKYKKRIEKHCPHCNTKFYVLPSNSKKYCSKPCADHYRGGFRSYKQLRRHQSIYCGYTMDSGAERYFAELLNHHGIRWIKNDQSWKKSFPYKKINQRWLRYYPDFYLPTFDMWIEIKGKRYMRPDDSLRYKCVPNHHLVMYDKILEFVDRLSILQNSNLPLNVGNVSCYH